MWRSFGVISRGVEESHGICQWNEDDSWRRLTARWDWGCNWNREDELDCHREDEESQLPERLRNLSITPSDDEHVGKLLEKLKSYHDDWAEHLRGGGYRHGVSMQKNGEYYIHKMHRWYIYTVQRREGLLLPLLLELLWSLCRRIEVWARRQSAAVEIHRRGRLHWRDMV